MKRFFVILWVLFLFTSANLYSQVINWENGVAISSVKPLNDGKITTYQTQIGLDYVEKGWYYLSSNVGYIRKGGNMDVWYAEEGSDVMFERTSKLRTDYVTLNTTFNLKKRSWDNYILYCGVGPRLDVKVKENNKLLDDDMYRANSVMFGLKCTAGVLYDFSDFRCGLNFSYLPTFTDYFKSISKKDQTFTFGISVGYKL